MWKNRITSHTSEWHSSFLIEPFSNAIIYVFILWLGIQRDECKRYAWTKTFYYAHYNLQSLHDIRLFCHKQNENIPVRFSFGYSAFKLITWVYTIHRFKRMRRKCSNQCSCLEYYNCGHVFVLRTCFRKISAEHTSCLVLSRHAQRHWH